MSETDAVELDATVAAWYEAARAAAAEIARWAEVRDRAQEHIKSAMGDAAEARIGGQVVVTWRPSAPARYIDVKALERDHPDVAATYARFKQAARPFKILDGGQ